MTPAAKLRTPNAAKSRRKKLASRLRKMRVTRPYKPQRPQNMLA
jgi:hypothetical protein